jgi:CubicO group peptidase (beta-lactamase class C family)
MAAAFKDVRVLTEAGLVAATRVMTVQDLLRHTAGLPYGELTQNPAVRDALTKAGLFKPGVIDFDVRDMTAAEEVERLAKVPLLYQPGTALPPTCSGVWWKRRPVSASAIS